MARACQRAGQFADAWDVAEKHTGKEANELLASLAESAPKFLYDRVQRVDYRRARLLVDRLAECGQALNPLFIALASNRGVETVIRLHAERILAGGLSSKLPELIRVHPALLFSFIELGSRSPLDPGTLQNPRQAAAGIRRQREHWRDYIVEALDRVEGAAGQALVPWLVPLLQSKDDSLRARIEREVRRRTGKDGPPFDPAELPRSLPPETSPIQAEDLKRRKRGKRD
ncbi:MAG TPA: hypothetical protein VFF73_34375 [Planctomycetota bacterium]|nr:hypothetical protein [Planctomycetota bacterium]